MRSVIFILALSLTAGNAKAEITRLDHHFKAICIADQSVGFDWINNNWKTSKYLSSNKLIVQKIKIEPHTDHMARSGSCNVELEPWGHLPMDVGSKTIAVGCYNLREVGEEFTFISSHVCLENWTRAVGKRKLSTVKCDILDFNFSPNGHFHRSVIHNNLNPKDDYKDSLFVQVGKCAVLNE